MHFLKRWLRAEHELDELEDIGLSVFLTALITLLFVILPMVDLVGLIGRFVSLGFTALFLFGCLIGDLSRFWRRIALALAASGAILTWIPATGTHSHWWQANLVLSIVFNLIICIALLRQIFHPGAINWHRLRGATAVYILIGFLFALVFALLEDLVPGSFEGLTVAPGHHLIRDTVYFSFVTLTSLGYGDITPITEMARNLAIVEALVGQIFLTILIGRLLSLSFSSQKS